MSNRSEIEALRNFAIDNNEVAFAHLCTAALAGEEWALSRIRWPMNVRAGRAHDDDAALLDVILATDTTRPDGAIARSFVDPFAKVVLASCQCAVPGIIQCDMHGPTE